MSNDDEIQEVSSGDERERNSPIRLQTAQSIEEARLKADDSQLEDAKDEDEVNEQETYEKQGRAFGPHHLAARGNEGPSSGTGKTKLRIITKREAPLEETKFNVTLELLSNETPGLDLVTVLNTSGTLFGQRLEKMKSAMQLVIKKLRPIDRLSVVTFSNHSETLCPLRYMTENDVQDTERLVNGLTPCGGTSISAGLEMGLQVLKNGCHESRRRVAIMLLCDGGQDRRREPDAAKVEIGNVPVYTFGFSSEYDTEVLKAIAKKSSGGMFKDVQNVDKLTEAFSQRLDVLLRLSVQDLELTITQQNSTKIEKVSAENYQQSRDDDVGSVTVSFGNLCKKELPKVIVDLLLPNVSSTECADILQIKYKYKCFGVGGELIHTNPIIVKITRRNSLPMINEAREVTDKLLEIANKMIIEAQKYTVDETIDSEVKQLKRLMNSQKLYDEQESEEVTIDDFHLSTAESGEGTIRSLEPPTVHSNNDVAKFPIEFLLDRKGVRERIRKSLNKNNNYVDWRKSVKKYLKELKLWNVIHPSSDHIENETRAIALKQFRENWMALILINQACGFPINLQIIDLDSAKAAWETLATNWNQAGSDVESFLSAVERGNWKKAERLLDSNRELATARIPSSQNTVLHLASLAGEVNIVKKLVRFMTKKDLEIQDKDGYTALAKASIRGNIRIAKCMVEMNKRLVSIPTGTKLLPVVIAMMYGNKEMASYLYNVTPMEDLTNEGKINGATLLTYSIRMQYYDISSELIQKCPRLAVALDHNGQSALYQLACTPSAFRSGCKLNFWQKLMYNCIPVQDNINWNSNDTRLSVPDEDVSQSNSWNLSDEDVSQSNSWNAEHRGISVQDINWNNNDTRLSVPDEDVSQSNSWNAEHRGTWQQKASQYLRAVLGIKRIYQMKLVHNRSPKLLDRICQQINDDLDDDEINSIINALHEAATKGVVEFIYGVLKEFPEFRWLRDKEGSTIFMKAVQFRQTDVFCLIHEFPSEDKMVVLVDKCGENILHKLKYSSVDEINTIQGGLIKMQKELKWLEETTSIMPPDSLKKENKEKKTAQELIDESHKRLIINAAEGMKRTAKSCIIVGILVVTIMFAAAFSVPGGNNQNTGLPILLKKKLFKIFIISDAVSFCFSIVSVLMFLGIQTSSYAKEDFLKPLPTKLIIAISSLFISLTAMMVAFTATLFIMLRREFWISIPVTVLLAYLPVILFTKLFFPLLFECVSSTYGPSIHNRRSKLLFIG